MLKDKIQLILIIFVTILVMTQTYTLVELVRLNSIDHGKQCAMKQKSFPMKYKYAGKMKSFSKVAVDKD